MLVSTLLIRCMALEFTSSPMDINMRDRGTKAEGRDLVFTVLGNGRLNLVTGKMGNLLKLVVKLNCLNLILQFILPKFLLLSR